MEKVSNLLVKFARSLFSDASEQDAFIQTLVKPQVFSPCILWCQPRCENPFERVDPLPWQPQWVDRLTVGQRPGQHPLHHEGAFYCLDFSSVFAASPLLTLPCSPEFALDMCAAPGGKSLFAWVALSPALLMSNEVIGKRLGALVSNLKRCQVKPAIVTSLDSQVLAAEIPGTAAIVFVDAPCTGQSLIAKGEKAPGCFHPVSINKNANRQKRILANSAQVVAPGGYLLYMTCAYSKEENEQVGAWFLERFPKFEAVSVPHLAAYQSHLSDLPCYRMWPQQGQGAGAFTMLFRNTAMGEANPLPSDFAATYGKVTIGTETADPVNRVASGSR